MEKETKKLLPGQRCDGFVDKGCPIGERKREVWIHKKIPKILGDGEDDFVMIEKAVKTDEADIQKEIEAQAAGCPTIKQLIREAVESGDEGVFNRHQLSYGDASDMPTDLHEAVRIVRDAKEKGMNLDDDKILSMSKGDIQKLIDEAVQKMVSRSKQEKNDNVNEVKQQEVKKEGNE